MKKLIVAVAVAVSNFVFAQTSFNPVTFDSDKDTTFLLYKSGDHDAKDTYGLLKHIFSDNHTYKLYDQINHRITGLIVNPYEDLNSIEFNQYNILLFGEWLNMYGGKNNFEKKYGSVNQFNFNYITNLKYESLLVYNKTDNKLILEIIIQYDNWEDLNSNSLINLGVIRIYNY